MGATKLCLLLLLGTTLAQQDVESEQSPMCPWAKRFKNFRQYVYDYEAESFSGAIGTDTLSGPKVSCKVSVDVPQTCRFILSTTDCSLSSISALDAEGRPVYRPAVGSEAFKDAMAKNVLKIAIDGEDHVQLYPEDKEPENILNIKRGIINALLSPEVVEDVTRDMPTVYGTCPSTITVKDTDSGVTVLRDVHKCSAVDAKKMHTSPLALITGMEFRLSRMISSKQTCDYKFDNQKKVMTHCSCTEKHLFQPLSSQGSHGLTADVKQTLVLSDTIKINDRTFEPKRDNYKLLTMDELEDKSPSQNKDSVIMTLQRLSSLSQTPDGQERAGLFNNLLSELRGLKTEALTSAAVEMMEISGSLTVQALVQCGTPECTGAFLKVLKTFDNGPVAVDATVYALGMLQGPSDSMVMDMLDMARHRKSRPVMYALGNTVRKLYSKLETTTPEMTEVYKFITSILGTDCAGEKDLTYLTLRVLGNIGDVMEAVDPAIKNTLVKCMRQPATTLSVQLAAIQAFRRMFVTSEVRSNLRRVSQYPNGAVQKRLAAYLVLMKNPLEGDMEMVKKLLLKEQNTQVKTFVSSHIYNIISSTDPDLQAVGQMIREAVQDIDIYTDNDFRNSQNYNLSLGYESVQAAVFSNIIFDPSSQLPREVMLETTLKAFGFYANIWEVGMEGKGFEPSIEALFGNNGFFPDTVSKAIYWAEDKMPPNMKEVLEKWVAPFKTPGQKIPENLGKEIVRNFNKLMKDLQSQESPEAIAYLRSMGEELGYIKAADLKSMAENAAMFADIFMRVLPSTVLRKLMSGEDQEMFAHYVFMDNKFMMPTAAGLPLTFAMTGTFAPGVKGGFRISPDMKELLFVPSAGVEFVTRMGVHVPEFVMAAAERHTTLYHESQLDAKLSMSQGQVKLSIPTPKGPIKLLRVSNKVVIVGTDDIVKMPDTVEESTCKPVFPGVKLCVKTLLSDTGDLSLIGDNVLAVDIMPTNEVSEYTATITYQLRQEEKDEKVDSLTLALRAEGAEHTEATAVMTYNRNRNIFLTAVQVPDMDVELGFKVSLTDSGSEGKSITMQFLDNNVPQLTLIGLAKLNSLTDGTLRVEMVVPSFSTNAAVTATLSKDDGVTMELKSEVKVVDSTSTQSFIVKYGEEQAEVQLVSNVNTDTHKLQDALEDCLRTVVDAVMDQQVVNTDMKLRHILKKGVEASNIWMDKIVQDAPYVETLRSSLTELEIPNSLLMNFDSKFRYKFNKDRFTITVPLPLGGKSSEELRIPPKVTSPQISLPQLGVDFASTEVQIPTFTIPSEYDLSLPLMGMVDMSAKVTLNSYTLETTFSAGNSTAESMSYEAKFNMITESPINVLSFSTGVETKLTETEDEGLKFSLDGDLKHMFVKTGVSVLETISVTDSVLSTGKYNVYGTSPLGLDTSLAVTTKLSLAPSMLYVDVNTEGAITVGSLDANSTYRHTFSADRVKREAKLESKLKVTSDLLKISNKIDASYAKEELLMESVTDMQTYGMKHKTKMSLSYKDIKLSMRCDAVTKADGKLFRSQIEASATNRQATLRIENEVDDGDNRAYSLITGSVNPSGVEVNTDASLVFLTRVAAHKGTFSLNTNGLTTSCTTTAQYRPMTFENVFHGVVDSSGVSTSLTTKGSYKENKAELNVEGKIATTEISFNGIVKGNVFDANARNRVVLKLNGDGLLLSNNMVGSFREMRTENTHSLSFADTTFRLVSKTDNVLDKSNAYKHDIKVEMVPFTATVVVKNDLKIMEVNFVNDAQFKAEPMQMELVGTLMGVYSGEELKHTYEIKFADQVFSAKCNTNGKLLGSHVTHTADIEVAGFSVKFNDMANINSPSLRLVSTVKTVAEPFALTIDAIFNSDGEVSLYGQHRGEVYSKFLLKAKPLLYTQSFEYRASTSHEQEGRDPLKTSIDNKFDSILSLDEQRFTLRIKSKVNDNTIDQEIKSYNDAVKMGVEMNGMLSTPLFSESNQEYSISGFLKYDKNSDSHFILVPFEQYFPVLVENAMSTAMELMQYSVQMVKDIDSEYKVSVTVRNKLSELKEVINNFNFNLVVKKLNKFLISAENAVIDMIAKFPGEKLKNAVKSIMETIMAWLQNYDIANKFGAIYTKIESILSEYEIEKMIEAIMDEIVKMMKHYQVREKIHSVFTALKSINLRPLFKKALSPVQSVVNALHDFDFQQMVNDVSNYLDKMMEKIKSFNYDIIVTELREKAGNIVFPCFGKLYGEFKFKSPHYEMKTTADMANTTTTSETPEFKLGFNSVASSTLKILDYTADASLHLSLPHESPVSISERITIDSSCFTLDYKATTELSDKSSVTSQTMAKVTTELYAAELANTVSYTFGDDVSAKSVTKYKHHLNFPPLGIFSDAQMNSETVLQLEDDKLHLTLENIASDKYAVMSFSDEANHKSSVNVVTDFDTATVTFNGETGFIGAKMIHTLTADMSIFDHLTIVAKAETEAPFMKNSVAEVKLQAEAGDLKINFQATHSAEMIGLVEGPVSNMASALIKPNELMFSTENKGNAKVTLPMKLSGKLHLQNDISLTLNSRVHQLAWKGLAKFNQYKYFHHLTVENSNEEIQMSTQINGEANLDFLEETISIPEIKVPYFGRRIPRLHSFSIWRDTGLGDYLITTQQVVDINSKLKYKKNPEMITIKVNLEPAINILHENVRNSKVKAASILNASYQRVKAEYEKYSNDLPSGFKVPAYRVPVIDLEMSSFTIPLPETSLFSRPPLYTPSAFSGLTLPQVTLPRVQTVEIPKMGDLTYEFSMKTAIITVKADASILNKDDMEIKLDLISSSSDFDLLKVKVQGHSSDSGFKVTSSFFSKLPLIETAHDSTVLLSFDNIDASISNAAEIDSIFNPLIRFNHSITLNSEDGLVVALFSPSAGRISFQMQTDADKDSRTQVNARLYGSYRSEPTRDIEILGLNMVLRGSEMPLFDTTYNMEIPNSLLVTTMKFMQEVVDEAFLVADFAIHELLRLGEDIVRVRRNKLPVIKPSEIMADFSNNTIMILEEYHKKVKAVLDAVYSFLKETKFHVPGYNQRLSGFEIYNKITKDVADVCEDAVERIPEYFKLVCDYILSIELPFPVSDYVFIVRETCIEFSESLPAYKRSAIEFARRVANIRLEDIMSKISELIQFLYEQTEMFVQSLKSANPLSEWFTEVYNNTMEVPLLHNVSIELRAYWRMFVEILYW